MVGLRALTAEVGTPPILGLSSSMGTLTGVFSQGMADAAGQVRALTETEVLPTSLQVAADVHQGRTVREQWTFQNLFTDPLDKGGTHAELRPWDLPVAPGLSHSPFPTSPTHSSQGSQIWWSRSSGAQEGGPGIAL